MRLKDRAINDNREVIPPGFLVRDSRERPAPGMGRRAAIAAGAFLAAVCLLVVADYAINSGEIHRGVSVGEVELGGLDRSEAGSELEERLSGEMEEIELRGHGASAISADEIGLSFNTGAMVERAYAVGREGGVFERLWQRGRATLGVGALDPVVDYSSEALNTEVEDVASRLEGGSGEEGVRLQGANVELVEPQGGYRVDVGATVESVEREVMDLSGDAELVGEEIEPGLDSSEREQALERARRAVEEPLVLAHDEGNRTLSSERVADSLRFSQGEMELDRSKLGKELSGALGALERSPVEAELVSGERGSVEVEPAREGREVQMQRLLDEIEAGIFEGEYRYEVPVSRVEPNLTTREAEAARPNTMIGEFETSYLVYDQPPRVENLKTASQVVNGTIIAPGETFSFNGVAAPISRYEPSEVIVNGRLDTALGGGLCQVASTLYMAANYAGLEIVERHPHSAELPYIRPGFDATVWFGSLDLKLRNNTGDYLLLEEKVDEQSGKVVARVYGKPTDREVEMSSRKLSESGDTTRWRSTRKVLEDGRVVESGKLNTDTYKALQPAAPAPTGRGA